MKYTGRLFATCIILFFHTAYILYYYSRDGSVDVLDLMGYPLFFAIAFWSGKQYDHAKFYSEKDILTGLYNRRFVINTFPKIASLVDRTNSRLFLLIIDCDNFKHINDHNGHQKGDMVLIRVGEILAKSTRKSDIVARWGGDEFLIIGQFKETAGVTVLMERIKNELQSLSTEMNVCVDVSIGWALYSKEQNELFQLIDLADKNMYKCKTDKRVL